MSHRRYKRNFCPSLDETSLKLLRFEHQHFTITCWLFGVIFAVMSSEFLRNRIM